MLPRQIFADPRTYVTFQRIFGSDKHQNILIAFLNDMLELDGCHRIVGVSLLPREQRPSVAELKLSIIGVKCIDARDVTYVVEVQVLEVEGFEKRVVEGVGKKYVHQIARGDRYPQQDDVVGITICDFEVWPDDGERKIPMLSWWRMAEQRPGARRVGQIQLVFLELPKYDASRPPCTMIEKWAYFFREAYSFTAVPEVLSKRPLVDALEAARIARFTVEEWDAYMTARIALYDSRGALAFAERRGERLGELCGYRKGFEQGLRESVQAVCGALGVELTEDRRRVLAHLDVAGLRGLLARLRERSSWT